ncbi:hypothetical protein DL766_005148 [Monosporascus sp. MC13-8B]|uniref:GPI anchored protein n=1 Tax=Monosporascus cannonballus TaxID=155416 RepID=A0ABY0HK50_9PEZI|nr:hypothetical protein DL762_000636 [Monosporascus cannonballus]RYP01419.1 hypothetical protein DL763_000229 [Monosporascus cannonballus]RYP29849.1 hypothetical protein DL766_005148 [Monosporascus sp. MC13-8B]
MLNSFVVISALTGMTAAQSSVVSSLFLPGFDSQSLVASIVTAGPKMMEFFVECAPGVDANDCGAGPGVSVTMQPGTYELGINDPPAFTMSERCVIEQQKAVCTMSALGSEANDPGVETTTMEDITTADFFMPVTITAGFDVLAAATATDAESTGGSTATPAQSADDSPVTPGPVGTETSASTQETSVSTGVAPRITRDAIVGGAAALVGAAFAL